MEVPTGNHIRRWRKSLDITQTKLSDPMISVLATFCVWLGSALAILVFFIGLYILDVLLLVLKIWS